MGNILAYFNWQDTGIISVKDVLQQLQSSGTFSWCIYRKRDIFIRHVGFVIIFDKKPFCTVDFEFESWVDYRSKVRIRRVPPDFRVDRGPVIQCLITKKCKKRAAKIINKLVTPNQEYYSLLLNNCRDNTIAVLKQVCDSADPEKCNPESLEETRQMLLQTKYVDSLLLVLSIQLARALGINLSALSQ